MGLDALLLASTGGQIRRNIVLGQQEALDVILEATGIIGGTPDQMAEDVFDLRSTLIDHIKLARQAQQKDPELNIFTALRNEMGNIKFQGDAAMQQAARQEYTNLMGRLEGALETFRDGSYFETNIGYKNLIGQKQATLNALRAEYSKSRKYDCRTNERNKKP